MMAFRTPGRPAPARHTPSRLRNTPRLVPAGRFAIGAIAAAIVLSAWTGVSGAATASREPSATARKVKGPALVKTATVGNLGTVLVTSQRFTLYVFSADKPGAIACLGSCLTEWAPL